MVVFKSKVREFPGGPVLPTLHFHCKAPRFDPSWRTKVPQAEGHGQKKKIVLNLKENAQVFCQIKIMKSFSFKGHIFFDDR